MFNRWMIVAYTALIYMVIIGTTYSAFGLFVIPVSNEFGLSRANMNSALIVLNVGSASLSPFIGRLLDRLSLRRVMAICAISFGLGLFGLGASRSVWLSAAILLFPIAIGMVGSGTLTASILVARWFTAERGRAMMLSAMGMSLAGLTVTPIVAWLIERMGWRMALMTVGVGVTVMLLLLVALIRERPASSTSAHVEVGATKAQAIPSAADDALASPPVRVAALLRRAEFWLIAVGNAIPLAIATALAITIVPLAIASGLTTLQATTLISIMGASAVGGKLLLSTVADKIDRLILIAMLCLGGALLNLALLLSTDFVTLVGCAVVLGVTSGAIAPVFFALVADRFGVASFGTARGLMAPIMALHSAAAVRIAGEVYDRTGGYELLFMGFALAQVIAVAMLCAARVVGSGNLLGRADKVSPTLVEPAR